MNLSRFILICLLLTSVKTLCQNSKTFQAIQHTVLEIQSNQDKNKHGFQLYFRSADEAFTLSSGKASPNHDITSETQFNIGSSSKTFTAVIAMDLVNKGLLSLDSKVVDYFSHNLIIDSTITIKNLLNHTSGIKDFLHDSIINVSLSNPKMYLPTQKEILTQITQKEAPNTRHDYTNSNYFLLSEIIERTLDKPFFLVLQDFIENNRLKNTHPTTGRYIKNLAHPYHSGIDLYQNINTHYYTEYCKGAGGICSNSEDVSLFFHRLFNYKILSKACVNIMKENYIDENKYGLGIYESIIDSKEYWGHAGDNVGYSSRIYHSPQYNYTVSILFNCSDYAFIKKTAHHILKAINASYTK